MPFYDYKCEKCGNKKVILHGVCELKPEKKRDEIKEKTTCCSVPMTHFTDWSKGAPGIGKFSSLSDGEKKAILKKRATDNKSHQEELSVRRKMLEKKYLGKE